MTELPQPDLMDQSGRARRLVLALIIGAAAAAAAYFIADAMAQPDANNHGHYYTQHEAGAYQFVWYVTAFAGALGFIATIAIGNDLAKRRWRKQLVAQARTIKS